MADFSLTMYNTYLLQYNGEGPLGKAGEAAEAAVPGIFGKLLCQGLNAVQYVVNPIDKLASLRREERARRIAHAASRPRGQADVLVLNEVFAPAASAVLLDELREIYPYQTPIVGLSQKGWHETTGDFNPLDITKMRGGVVILSKWPITYQAQHIFCTKCGIEAMCNKGIAYAAIDIGKKFKNRATLHLIGTHTQAEDIGGSRAKPGYGDCWAERKSQFREINEFIDQLYRSTKSRPGAPDVGKGDVVLIAGDLNVHKGNTAEYQEMLGLLRAQEPTYDPKSFPCTWDPKGNSLIQAKDLGCDQQWLDYVLIRDSPWGPSQSRQMTLRAIRAPDGLSDHYPVVFARK